MDYYPYNTRQSIYLKQEFDFITLVLVATAMEKGHKRSRSVGIKSKLFEIYLTGRWGDYDACIKILDDLDLIEHGIQFLCVKEGDASTRPRNRDIMDIDLDILIEMKEGTDVEEMVLFFRALLIPFQRSLSLIKLCKNPVNLKIMTHGGDNNEKRNTYGVTLCQSRACFEEERRKTPCKEKKAKPLGLMIEMKSGTYH